MKRLFYFICFAATVLAIVAGSFTARLAVTTVSAAPGDPVAVFREAGKTPRDIRLIIAQLVKLSLGSIAFIVLLLCLYAGYLWSSARGNDDQVATAQKILRNAVIGLILIMLSYALTSFLFRAIFVPPNTIDRNTRLNSDLESQPYFNRLFAN
ncbi:MAG: hypothetical protein HY461_01370 [Parcubacteria group bacterium]|nr:hypothetical protein [Parcubacteria group bacterium]